MSQKMDQVATLESVPVAVSDLDNIEHINTLGSVRLHNVHTKEIVLVPQPSDDPNDPLNWYVTTRRRIRLHLIGPDD